MSEMIVNEKEKRDSSRERFEPSIKNFLCDKYSICREERQYVVFLYNILRKYATLESRKREGEENADRVNVKKIFESCGLKDDAFIDYVFYEPAFLRDFFERYNRLRLSKESEWPERLLNKSFSCSLSKGESARKEDFNTKLIQYVYEQKKKEKNETRKIEVEYSGRECNLGQNNNKLCFEKLKIYDLENNQTISLNDNEKKWIKHRVKWMMNAQPDIALIYHLGEEESAKKFLLFIECKFTSKESSYRYEVDSESNEKEHVKQGEIQWMIADFLCSCLHNYNDNKEKMTLSPSMKEERSHFVYFVRRYRTNENNGEKKDEILIEDLIRCNNEIFALS